MAGIFRRRRSRCFAGSTAARRSHRGASCSRPDLRRAQGGDGNTPETVRRGAAFPRGHHSGIEGRQLAMTVAKRFGISFEGTDPPEHLRSMVALADDAGIANAWIASHLFHREPIACAAMALATSRQIGIVLMAMSPYTV